MKQFLLLLFLGGLSMFRLSACDVCGGASVGGLTGLTSSFQQHYLNLRWRYLRFHVSDQLDGGEDYFQQAEIRVGYRPKLVPRLGLILSVPWYNRKHLTKEENSSLSGMGDLSLIASYTLLNTPDSLCKRWNHLLSVGAGIKAPTARYEQEQNGHALAANFQLGSGSWDYLWSVFYSISYQNLALNAEFSGRLNQANPNAYQFGNQLGCSINAAWRYVRDFGSLTPYIGVYGEKINMDTAEKLPQADTGGSGWYAQTGLESRFGQFAFGTNIQLPLRTSYAQGFISGGLRALVSCTYLM